MRKKITQENPLRFLLRFLLRLFYKFSWQVMLNRGIVLFYTDAITALKHSFSGLLSARLS